MTIKSFVARLKATAAPRCEFSGYVFQGNIPVSYRPRQATDSKGREDPLYKVIDCPKCHKEVKVQYIRATGHRKVVTHSV